MCNASGKAQDLQIQACGAGNANGMGRMALVTFGENKHGSIKF